MLAEMVQLRCLDLPVRSSALCGKPPGARAGYRPIGFDISASQFWHAQRRRAAIVSAEPRVLPVRDEAVAVLVGMFFTDMEDFAAVRVDVVRWPRDTAADHARVGVVTVNYNTAPLVALLLWSLYRVLDTSMLEQVVVVDNGSTDGSAQLLSRLTEASLCRLVANAENRSHGPGINQGISYLAQRAYETGRGPAWVWVLDSDCVVARPDALQAALRRTRAAPAVIGESQPDPWHGTDRFGTHCLLIDPARTWHDPIATFDASGDPSFGFLASCQAAGLPLAEFGFLRDGYVIHRGRGTLAYATEPRTGHNLLLHCCTWITAPVSSVAGLVPPLDTESPRTPGSVCAISRSTALGSCTSDGSSSMNRTSTSLLGVIHRSASWSVLSGTAICS